ncbi:G2-specific protein kinase nimA [Pseudocercospora fuligena]|uniref:non-specific serine/threonine protein kinase n=1 Tax=Pseudocercospora fuligena TaxID=685502 RepID=A0A8H6RH95_9PEZI|nr:G2-specific protein kinase nimA [Pseudocercospora fuligena]
MEQEHRAISMPPKKQGKVTAAAKDTVKAPTNKRKAEDRGDDDDTSVPKKVPKMLRDLHDREGKPPALLATERTKRPQRRAKQTALPEQTAPQSTTVDDGDEQHEDDAAPEPETQPGGTRGRTHDPIGSVNDDELQPPLSHEDGDEILQDRPRSQGKGKGRQHDHTPELQSGPKDGLPIRLSPDRQESTGTGRKQSKSSQALPGARMGTVYEPDFVMDRTSQAIGDDRPGRPDRALIPVDLNAASGGEGASPDDNERVKQSLDGLDAPQTSPVEDGDAGQIPSASTDSRTRDQGPEVRDLDPAGEVDRKRSEYIDAWQDIWYRLGGLQVSDATFSRYRWLHMRSNFCADNNHFADLGTWPDEEDANTYLLDVQKAVEMALLAYYKPLWQEWIEEAQIDFGQAAVDVWNQQLQQERFRGIANDRTRLRFEEAHRRAQEIRINYNFWLRPLKNIDGPEYRSIADYCDKLHDHLTEQLIEDVRRRDWPPQPWDAAMQARFNRMKTKVMQGFPAYPAAIQSPVTASFTEVAGVIGFDHERSQQGSGRWQHMGPLGSGGFGSVGVWARYDKYGRVVDRFALKDSYMARMNGNGTEDYWNNGSHWYGNIEDRVPKEYFAMQMLNQNPDSENIVQCKAYGVYDEKRMYRLYLEYCPHADLETTIHAYLKFAELDREPDDPKVQIPNRALWCIFQALAAALCLMDRGFIPNATSGSVTALPRFQQMLHRDLKPANVFLGLPKDNGTWPEIPVPKLGDFGGVKFTNEPDATTSQFGTDGYFAPESLEQGVTHAIGPHSDIWAIGRIMLSLINLSHVDDPMIPRWVGFTDFPSIREGAEVGYDQRLRDLVMNCLAPVPAARPSATELLRRIQIEVAPTTESPGAPRSISVQEASDEEMLMFVTDRYLPFATA